MKPRFLDFAFENVILKQLQHQIFYFVSFYFKFLRGLRRYDLQHFDLDVKIDCSTALKMISLTYDGYYELNNNWQLRSRSFYWMKLQFRISTDILI